MDSRGFSGGALGGGCDSSIRLSFPFSFKNDHVVRLNNGEKRTWSVVNMRYAM